MADWQGIALVISSTTALLAVGSPFALRWWEEQDRRKREKKDQIEGHLFFILDNYQSDANRILAPISSSIITGIMIDEDKKYSEAAKEDASSAPVDSYRVHLVKLKVLLDLYSVDDDGFCLKVEEYASSILSTRHQEDLGDILVHAFRELEYRREIEQKAVSFLRNIQRHFD